MQKKSVVAVLTVVGTLLLSSVPMFAQGRQRRLEHCQRDRHQAAAGRHPLGKETARRCQHAADRHGSDKVLAYL